MLSPQILHPNSHVSTFVYGLENGASEAIQYTRFTNNTFLEMSNNTNYK